MHHLCLLSEKHCGCSKDPAYHSVSRAIKHLSGKSHRPLTPILLQKSRDTPPISIAILLQKYALFLAESSVYTANLYHDTPPFCIAILLQKY